MSKIKGLKVAGLMLAGSGLASCMLLMGQDLVKAEEINPLKVIKIENGSFEEPALEKSSGVYAVSPSLLKWNTTDKSGRVEVMNGYDDHSAADGNQWVELAATEASTLYQDIETSPGTRVRWSVQHRGRTGVDTAEVQFGEPNGQMQTQKTMVDGPTWSKYQGSYVIPEGQTVTRFAFTAISSSDGDLSYGNWLDDVVFSSQAILTLTGNFENTTLAKNQKTTYNLEVLNEGGMETSSNTVTIDLPEEVTYVANTLRATGAVVGNESSGAHQITFFLGNIPVGEKATVSIDVKGDRFVTNAEATAKASYQDKGYNDQTYQAASNKALMSIDAGEAPVITADDHYTLIESAAIPDVESFKEAIHASAVDKEDGTIQDIEVIDLEKVDADTPGIYLVTLRATDSSGNTAEHQVTVVVEAAAGEEDIIDDQDDLNDDENLPNDDQAKEESVPPAASEKNDLIVSPTATTNNKTMPVAEQKAILGGKKNLASAALPKTGDTPFDEMAGLLGAVLVLLSFIWLKKNRSSKNSY